MAGGGQRIVLEVLFDDCRRWWSAAAGAEGRYRSARALPVLESLHGWPAHAKKVLSSDFCRNASVVAVSHLASLLSRWSHRRG